ncbi:MAG: arginase family protein [Deltaproteobacteria bacterium]|nr:arginase family protein [Deltaproteobacteria bacterium]
MRPAEVLTVDEALDELALYLRPPGQGIYAVSTGRRELLERTKRYLGAELPDWRAHLEGLKQGPRVALLAVPSDAGAGIVRGAAHGPMAIREELGVAPAFELGDVFTVPHFIEDAMLSSAQLAATRASIYSAVPSELRAALPVSPIDLTARAYELLGRVSPATRIHLLGGDHTVAYGAILGLFSRSASTVGIVHFDAHTDLLGERLGVRICFATWAHHANALIGRGQRLIQLGIRASARGKLHWESAEDVRQVWAEEARGLAPEELGGLVAEHLRAVGAQRIYVSNDLDGTDSRWAAACGTPEPDGLSPEAVLGVLDALDGFEVLGADLVELAPGLSLDREASRTSIETAARYVRRQLQLLGR